jgi:hypothetical protein
MIYPKKKQEKIFFQMVNYLDDLIRAAGVFKLAESPRWESWPIYVPVLTAVNRVSGLVCSGSKVKRRFRACACGGDVAFLGVQDGGTNG